ncbi:hypothetical protein [Paraburkholderia diazotrophica]|uniref:Meckel syndrome type 1 protein n=1 Tax=Paraburkholderia diazotrophica TaxID=667676 RepID=A0A1H7EH86_9BURK|nr:hypothetical protein [Paraburkholderia diazotrophica]SEK13333.1 Meckel syndrome type 1 protein [Paraburkholderia diazotrophica]
MDIREIQRLHAQFAPDSMVIDLPRQIAALPGPGDVSAPESSRALHQRIAGIAPRARQATIALAIAAMVAMAGMGAASLYKNLEASHGTATTAPTTAEVASRKGDALNAAPANQEAPAYREVNATPPHPVSAAPALSASDFASARSLGLTADQFRDSLKAPARSAQAATVGTTPALTSEAQLAAVSPIHRAGSSREATAAAQQPASPSPAAPAQPVAVARPVVPVQSATQPAQAAATTAQAPATAAQTAPALQPAQQPAEAAKPARAARHHISRPRAEQSAESNTDARPSAENRAGSAEVKMF